MNTTAKNPVHRFFKILRWIRRGVFFLAIIGLFYLFRRFEILKIPSDYRSIPAGSYVLLDWHFLNARPLMVGDRVLYKFQNQKLTIGTLLSLPHSDGIPEGYYLIQPEMGSFAPLLQPSSNIKARILLILIHSESIPLPR